MRAHRRRRGLVVPEVAVRVVLHDRQPDRRGPGRDGLAPRRAHAAAARVLEIGQQVEETRAPGRVQRVRRRAFVVAGHRQKLRLVRREGLQRAQVRRRLHRDAAARIDQHLADQVQPLLRAGRDQHLGGRDLQALGLQLRRRPFAQRAETFARGVLQRLARGLRQHPIGGGAQRLDRKTVGRRQPAGERDDAGPFGQLQDLADHRRFEPLGAACHLPGRRHDVQIHSTAAAACKVVVSKTGRGLSAGAISRPISVQPRITASAPAARRASMMPT